MGNCAGFVLNQDERLNQVFEFYGLIAQYSEPLAKPIKERVFNCLGRKKKENLAQK